jgi:hypothetical protein
MAARLAGWVVVLALSLGATRAAADRLAIAPARVTASREVSGALKEQFRVSLSGGLVAAGHEVLPDEQIAILVRRSPDLGACDTDTCFRRFGELVGADAVLRAAVEVLGSSNYQVRLEVYDVGDRGLLASVEDACTVCTVREANDALSRAAAEVGRRFTARVRPPVVAPAPVAAPVVQAAPPIETPRWTPHAKALLGGGITLLALGAGGVGAGAALIATDSETTSMHFNAANEVVVDTHHTTLVPGIVVTSVGAAVMIGGSILVWRAKVAHDHPHR